MDKNEKYYMLLAMQYQMSIGISGTRACLNFNSKRFNKELLDWLKERRKIGYKYVDFLNYLGLDITTRETAEIDKGKYDSIVTSYDTSLITPYYYGVDIKDDKVLNYVFFPDSKNPALLKIDYMGKLREITSAPNYINQYITENPYRRTDIFGFEELHNGGNFNIIVGMYGHIHDNDKEKKLKQLKDLREKIIDSDIKIEYDCDRDSYFALVASDRKIKNYVKTKTR